MYINYGKLYLLPLGLTEDYELMFYLTFIIY